MIVQTYGLTKYYGKTCGVEDLDLSIKEGEIFGYLGPNGSGKTTTLRLLLDLIRPTRGRAEIFGLDTRRYSRPIRQRLGYVPGDVAFYEGMTGDELLGLIGHLHQGNAMKREKELAERLDIDLRHKIKTYSKGTKQKLAIIQALMGDPDLLIL
ncbi:MAG: ABC transporter ATP-binding protein, partial [Chloroflexi bacterium]|nr:ABC transporter ATP-binding protein [Chloroflexota bacterium]